MSSLNALNSSHGAAFNFTSTATALLPLPTDAPRNASDFDTVASASASKTNPKFPVSTENFGPQVNFTIWFLTALSGLFLALRVYCKFLRHRGLWWDDHVLIVSWISLALSSAFISLTVTLGFGKPLFQFNIKFLSEFLLYSNAAGSFSILAAQLSKTSFAITVLRISSGWLKRLVWFIIISVNIALGLALAFTWSQCDPIEKTWMPWVEGTCWSKFIVARYNMFTAVYSGVMDIVLAIVPWKIVWTLSMNKREKAGVMIAMSMGIFAGVTSCIKVTQISNITNPNLSDSTTQLVILGSAESAISIMAASIPILRALLRDSRPPPGPAQFYHNDIALYTGTENARGTGRSSTVISSNTRSQSRWSKEIDTGLLKPISRISRMSGLSLPWTSNRRSQDLEIPAGKIIQTEEVVVEYEPNQWVNIGRAI
ncbi:hypothetical protein GQ53DRAFT_724516 [Thozetella sp. PMI_491]|nr:hypothetical protein GQ53DRAFT_724516 [Thozetella sp. PMI_491]